jgi:hypothetical protein
MSAGLFIQMKAFKGDQTLCFFLELLVEEWNV